MTWRSNLLRGLAGAAAAIALVGVVIAGHSLLFRPPLVKTAVATLAPVSEVVYGTGIVEPVRWAKVVPLQRRRLVDLCRCEGQAVKIGQVLGRQEDAEERAAMRELELRYDQLNRDLQRADTDRRNNKITRNEYEQKETLFKEVGTRVTAQKERLETLVLRAPMDGMVLRRDGEVGEIVGPTDVLFWVGPPTPMHVLAEINEEEITKIAVGQKALLRNDAFSTEPLPATVSQVTPKGDPLRKTFRVYLLLPRSTPLRIGMTVEANIVFREKPAAVVVPAEAVIANAVQVVRDGKVQQVPVTVGIRGSRFVEIVGNVSRGMIVMSPARLDIADGHKVQTEQAQEPVIGAPASANAKPGPASASSAGDPSSEQISAAMSARIQSIVGDARRNAKTRSSYR